MEWIKNILNSLSIYFPNYEITFWDKFEKDNNKLIIPKSFSKLKDDIFFWLILFLSEYKWITDRITFNLLDNLEKEQILKLHSYLKIYNNEKQSFIIDKKWKIKIFFKYLASNISSKWPLWEFIKEELVNTWNYNLNELIEKYLDYKWAYLEQKYCDNEIKNNLLDDANTYQEHDGLDMNEIDWEDNWVIGYLNPSLSKSYFIHKILEKFNFKDNKFYQNKSWWKKINQPQMKNVISNYVIQWKKWKKSILPMNKNLEVVSFDNNVLVYRDWYWRYLVEFLNDWLHNISIWYADSLKNFYTSDAEKVIYTWKKIDLWKFKNYKDLKNYIKWKKYENISQIGFNTGDVNNYVENLFYAESMDCLPANILFVILARSLWYKTRLITWFQTYKKEWKTYISKNKWHAWSEIYINWTWITVDATPVTIDNNENENWDLDELIEIIQESEQSDKNINKIELKNGIQEHKNDLIKILQVDSIYLESAIKYVENDANEIIFYIKNLINQRKNFLNKTKLNQKPKRKKWWQSHWKLKISSSVIEKISTWDIKIFERNIKNSIHFDENIDTLLQDISVAIDISWSMWKITGDWENWDKLDYAYLSVVLIYLVSKWLNIKFDNIILFSDSIFKGNLKDIVSYMEKEVDRGWNKWNTLWIKKAVIPIKDSKKWVCFIISDWDWETWVRFFDDEIKNIIKQNKNLKIIWYWIWKDATSKLYNYIKWWIIPTVIEYRMQEAGNSKQSKWYNVENYKNLVEQLKKHLELFMTSDDILL